MSQNLERKRSLLNNSDESNCSDDGTPNEEIDSTTNRKISKTEKDDATSSSSSYSSIHSSEEEDDLKPNPKQLITGSFLSQSLTDPKHEKRLFSKICGPSNIMYFAEALKDWIKTPHNDDFTFTSIPLNILDKLIWNEKWKMELVRDENLQKKLIHHIIETLYTQSRELFLEKKFGLINFNFKCFRKTAKHFNTDKVNLFTKITPENMPNSEELSKIYNKREEVCRYLRPEDVETFRNFFLTTYEHRKQVYCDCCIQMYIQTELKDHKDDQFKQSFPTKFEKDGLSNHGGPVDDYADFQKYH